MSQDRSALIDNSGKTCVTAGELNKAKRRALTIFDQWLRITGAIPEGSSWVWECESIIEDAVEIGVQAAYGIYEPLDAEESEATE